MRETKGERQSYEGDKGREKGERDRVMRETKGERGERETEL